MQCTDNIDRTADVDRTADDDCRGDDDCRAGNHNTCVVIHNHNGSPVLIYNNAGGACNHNSRACNHNAGAGACNDDTCNHNAGACNDDTCVCNNVCTGAYLRARVHRMLLVAGQLHQVRARLHSAS